MEETIEDYINLNERFENLDCIKPNSFCFLPENIEGAESINDFIYTDNTLILRKLFKKNAIPEDKLENVAFSVRQRRSNDLFLPTIFISYTLFSQNPDVLSLGINVLSSYITDFFKGTFGKKEVKVEFVIELQSKKNFKKITYTGSVEGLKSMEKIIKSIK